MFSPPKHPGGDPRRHRRQGVSRVEIEDRGLGMSDEQTAAGQQPAGEPRRRSTRLARTSLACSWPVSSPSATTIKISLRPSPYGGTTAIVLIPQHMVVPEGKPRQGPGRAGADRRHAAVSRAVTPPWTGPGTTKATAAPGPAPVPTGAATSWGRGHDPGHARPRPTRPDLRAVASWLRRSLSAQRCRPKPQPEAWAEPRSPLAPLDASDFGEAGLPRRGPPGEPGATASGPGRRIGRPAQGRGRFLDALARGDAVHRDGHSAGLGTRPVGL